MKTIEKSYPVIKTYGKKSIASLENFQGGYINFGYWKDVDIKKEISTTDRIKASHDLYKLIFDLMGNLLESKVLEVGCGEGLGCIALDQIYCPLEVVGIDISEHQIQRCKSKLKPLDTNIEFCVGESTNIPFENEHFDLIYSVEAAQCFPSIANFALEARRVLKSNGKLLLTAHFSTSDESLKKLKSLIPSIDEGIDLLTPIDEVIRGFTTSGFRLDKLYSIGDHVFPGYEKWLNQVEVQTEWSHNVFLAFKRNYLDFYVLELTSA